MQTLEKHAFPVLAHMRVDQIQRQDILRVLTPIWTTRMGDREARAPPHARGVRVVRVPWICWAQPRRRSH